MLVTPSASARTDDSSGGWTRFEAADTTFPAGKHCDFELFSDVVRDNEFFKNVSLYPDGSPRTQLFKGPLVIQYTNMETGASVVRDLTGNSAVEYAVDGSFRSITIQNGSFSGGMPDGGSHPRGRYIVTGRWSSLTVNGDGTNTIALGPNGTAENICDTLAG
ncbi:MAG: hypothetical protein GEU96_18290 [Propionibacteriales bacterium]|nr:hypothetical protein [Propionibacteriales bacterium]